MIIYFILFYWGKRKKEKLNSYQQQKYCLPHNFKINMFQIKQSDTEWSFLVMCTLIKIMLIGGSSASVPLNKCKVK